MKGTKTIEANISDTIALCYIKHDFEKFNQKLIEYLKKISYSRETLSTLRKISHGEKVRFSRKTKNFYKENKEIIDTINTHSDIVSFIHNNYNLLEDEENICFINDVLYQYILKHQDYSVKIFLVLYKMKELGFKSFEFNESLDFSNQQSKINKNLPLNYALEVYDNIELIPCYDKTLINYKTKNSNYKITLFFHHGELLENSNKILLNDLTFDINRLPKDVTIKTIREIFEKALEDKIEEYTLIRNSVDIYLNADELENTINNLENIINSINEQYNKKELKETVSNIKEKILNLKTLINFYENLLIEKNTNITSSLLDKEKKLCKLKKR